MNTNKLDWRLLKQLYSIHSPSGKEDKMIKFLVNYLSKIPGVELGTDKYGNLYAWKGDAQTYPCIVAHLDQVQRNHPKDFKAIETRDIIFGFSPSTHSFCNLGADDKNGVFLILEAFKQYPCIKAAFFREEEIGCKGSSNCLMTFFENVKYVLQCDRRGNSDIVTSIGFTDLCSEKFIQDIDPERHGFTEATGLMTDVETLKEKGLAVSAINISTGYYNPHSEEELTIKRDLLKCWELVQHIIEDCTETYPHEAGENGYYMGYYDEWEVEEEIHALLSQDPTMTADDLYYMYSSNYPRLTHDDFERIVQEHKDYYCDDEDDYQPFNSNPKTDGKEENDSEILV